MYYDEKLINGEWFYRTTPHGEWKPITRRELMRWDVLTMAERADGALTMIWQFEANSFAHPACAFLDDCRAFAEELAGR